MPDRTAEASSILTELASLIPATHAAGATATPAQITDSAYLDARDRAERAKLLDSLARARHPPLTEQAIIAYQMAEMNLALAREALARVKAAGSVAMVPAHEARGMTRAAGPVKTVNLPEGTHERSEIRVNEDTVFRGVSRKTKVRSPDRKFAYIISSGVKAEFHGIDFDGSAVTYEGQSTPQMDDCTFTNFTRGVNVGFGNGTAVGNHNNGCDPQNMRLTNLRFYDSPGGWGIGFWRGNNVYIADCLFDNILNGIKSNNGGATAHNIVITRCRFNKISRMFMELQGQVDGFELSDTYAENQVLGPNFQDNIHALGHSVIYHGDETRNAKVVRNTINCPQTTPGDHTGTRLAFEIGNNFTVEDNYVPQNGVGTFTSCFMGDSSGPRTEAEIGHSNIRNNKQGARHGPGGGYGQFGGNAHYSNNNLNVTLTWDINRPKPGPGGSSTPTPDPTPEPEPTPVPDSSDNTYIRPGGSIGFGGKAYTIAGGHVTIGGTQDHKTSAVVGLLLFGGKLYQDQGKPTWWVSNVNPPTVGEQWFPTTDPRTTVLPPDPAPTPDTFYSTVVIPFSIGGVAGAQTLAVVVDAKAKTVKVK